MRSISRVCEVSFNAVAKLLVDAGQASTRLISLRHVRLMYYPGGNLALGLRLCSLFVRWIPGTGRQMHLR